VVQWIHFQLDGKTRLPGFRTLTEPVEAAAIRIRDTSTAPPADRVALVSLIIRTDRCTFPGEAPRLPVLCTRVPKLLISLAKLR
jgi:hypothetical protein